MTPRAETDDGRLVRARIALTASVFFSAALVFALEPMAGRLALPVLGGGPSIWNASLAFFQVALLAGYAYAHLLQRVPQVRIQLALHAAVLLVAAAALPIRLSHAFGDPPQEGQAVWLVSVLAVSIGGPFAALSASAPLIQAWWSRTGDGVSEGSDPFPLYAASNLGSLLALLLYPAIAEPLMGLSLQATAWSSGYFLFVALVVAAGAACLVAGVHKGGSGDESAAPRPTGTARWRERAGWLALSALPSSLMLGVTAFVTTDVVSAPFLWVIPLALYLLTFVIAFRRSAQAPAQPGGRIVFLQSALVIACLYGGETGFFAVSATAALALHLSAFFLTALMLHTRLAAARPEPGRLTEYYLCLSLGGVIGGAFNAFLAPVLFNSVIEYPAVLIACGLFRPARRDPLTPNEMFLVLAGAAGAAASVGFRILQGGAQTRTADLLLLLPISAAFLLRDRRWICAGLCLVLAAASDRLAFRPDLLLRERDFFGVIQVNRVSEPGLGATRELLNGTTLHGAEAEDPALRCKPLMYYAPDTPIGQAIRAEQALKPGLRLASVGMGAGAVAAYVRPADALTFYEIDPAIIGLSAPGGPFAFIRQCARGAVDWRTGDARVSLGRAPAGAYDLLLVDAFASDSIPAHLLTVEAIRIYLSKIRPDGIVIIHVSNRNLDLLGPVAATAAAAGGSVFTQEFAPAGAPGVSSAAEQAVLVGRSPHALAPFRGDPRWRWPEARGSAAWTDDHTRVFEAFARMQVRRLSAPGF